MPHRPALRCGPRGLIPAALAAVILAGCTQPGRQAPRPEAAKLFHATGDISLACGYAQELTAFGGPHAPGLGAQSAMAITGARLLVDVWSRDRTSVYQGEKIDGLVIGTISLLGECGLGDAQRFLERAISRPGAVDG